MENLLLFVKNNKVLYKVSVLLIVIMMLISVVQLIPNRENNKKVSASIENDYTLVFDASTHTFYKSTDSSEITASSLGITVDKDGSTDVLKLDNFEFKTKASVALSVVNGDVIIELADSSVNKFTSTFNPDANEFYGIVARDGSITFRGTGKLEVSSYNWNETRDYPNCGIHASGSITIENGVYNIDVKGRNSRGITSENTTEIKGGSITCNAGDKGDCAAIRGKKKVNISGGKIYGKVKSTDKWAGGIETGNGGTGDSINIRGGQINLEVSSDVEGKGIDTGKLDISGGTIKIDINGYYMMGLWATSKGGDGQSLTISNGAEVLVTGNISGKKVDEVNYLSYGVVARNCDLNVINGGKLTVDVKNKREDVHIWGISVDGNFNITDGNVSVSHDVCIDDNDQYSGGHGVYTWGNITVSGNSKFVVNSNTDGWSNAIYTAGTMTINDGYVEAKNTNPHSNDVVNAGISIEKGGNLVVNGGKVVASSNSYAIWIKKGTDSSVEAADATFTMNTEDGVKPVVASWYVDGRELVAYDSNNITYKYLEICKVYPYYLRYNATNKAMYKVEVAEDGTETTSPITNTELPGWSISNGELVLEGLNFASEQKKVLDIVGDATIRVKDGTTNYIGSYANCKNQYAINTLDNLTIVGKGKLNINFYNTYDGNVVRVIEVGQSSNVKDLSIIDTNINIRASVYNVKVINVRGGITLTNTTLNMNVYGNTVYGIGCWDGRDMSITNSVLSMDIICNGTGSSINGILAEGNLNIDRYSTVKLDIKGKTKSKGITCNNKNGTFSNHGRVNIDIDIDGDINTEIDGIWYKKIEMNEGIIDINVKGGSTSYGTYCTESYNQNSGIVNIKVTSDSGNGVYVGDVGTISIQDGTLDISANVVIDKVPTLNNSNVSISCAKQGGSNVESPSVNDVQNYNYVRIEPTYYYRYNASTHQLYKNESTDGIDNVPGLTVDAETGHLIMDGFNFTTSNNYGLKCEGTTTIEVKDGSKNSIKIDYSGASKSVGIYSSDSISFTGKGQLKVEGNVNEITGVSATTTVSITNTSLDIDVHGKTEANGIIASQNIEVVDAIIKLNVVSDKNKINGMCSLNSNIDISTSNIDIYGEVVSNDTDFKMIYAKKKININDSKIKGNGEAYGTALKTSSSGYTYYDSCQYFIYAKGYTLTNNDKAIQISNVEMDFDSHFTKGYAMCNDKGQFCTNDSEFNINMLINSSDDKAYAYAIDAMYACSISNSNIYAISNAVGFSGIMTWDGNVYIYSSNIYFDAKNRLTGIEAENDNCVISIDSSEINMNYKKGDGICTVGWYYTTSLSEHISINNSLVNLDSYGSTDEYMWGIYSKYGYLEESNSNIQFNLNCASAYGIEVYKGVNIKDSIADIKVDKTQNEGEGIGIKQGENLAVTDSDINVNGSTKALQGVTKDNLILNASGEKVARLVEASKMFKNTEYNTILYPSKKEIADYKYIKISNNTHKSTDEIPLNISQKGYYRFSSAQAGYSKVNGLRVDVTNMSDLDASNVKIELEGEDAASFSIKDVDGTGISGFDTLTSFGTSSFVVEPNTGLDVGTYSAVVCISSEDGKVELAGFKVLFKVYESISNSISSSNNYIRCEGGKLYEGDSGTAVLSDDIKDNISATVVDGKTIITLTNFRLDTKAKYGLYIKENDVEIRLVGENYIKCNNSSKGAAIYVEGTNADGADVVGNLTIVDDTTQSGVGELDVVGSATKNYLTEGILANNNVTIGSGLICSTIINSTEGKSINAIHANKDVNIRGGVVFATANGECEDAIQAEKIVNITGGVITAIGDGSTASSGIWGKYGVTIDGGLVNASAYANGGYGIGTSKVITISETTEGTTYVNVNVNDNNEAAIVGEEEIIINGGEIQSKAINENSPSCIYSPHKVYMKDGKVKTISDGINATGFSVINDVRSETAGIIIENGQVDVTVHGDDIAGIYGQYCPITINNGDINVQSDSELSSAIRSNNSEIIIKDGKIDIDMKGKGSEGLGGDNGVNITGGEFDITVLGDVIDNGDSTYDNSIGIHSMSGNVSINATKVNIVADGSMVYGIRSNGTTTISGGIFTVNATGNECTGIRGETGLDITGGELNVITEGFDTEGIYAPNGTVTIGGGTVTVSSTGDTAVGRSAGGIVGIIGVIIKDGVVNASAIGSDMNSIYSGGNVTINGGNTTVIASADEATNKECTGIRGKTGIEITDGELDITTDGYSSEGINSPEGNVIFSGGVITAHSQGERAYPIKSNHNIDISNCTITATAEGNQCTGIRGVTGVKFSNSEIDVTARGKNMEGIYAPEGTVTIGGGNITVNSIGNCTGESDICDSGGIIGYNGVTINAGTIKSTTDGDYAGAIYSQQEIAINGGSVTAIAQGGNNQSSAIYGLSDIQITAGKVYASSDGTSGNAMVSANGALAVSGGLVIAKGLGNDSTGMRFDNGVTITGGEIRVSAKERIALSTATCNNMTLSNSAGQDVRLVEASTVYKDKYTSSDLVDSPNLANLSSYYYIKICGFAPFYLRYYADRNEMYKVTSEGVQDDTPLSNGAIVSGWTTVTEEDNNKLVLNGFNFITTTPIGLEVVGEAKNIVLKGDNNIQLTNVSSTSYGIKGDNNITFTGKGTLGVTYNNDNYENSSNVFNGVYATGDISVTNSTINIDAQENTCYGINSSGNVNLYNTNATINSIGKAGYGIQVSNEKNLTITGGQVIALGGKDPINVAYENFTMSDLGDYSTRILEVSKNFDGSGALQYTSKSAMINYNYKYMKIGVVPNYYFRYENNKMYKVPKIGEAVELTTDGELVPGWSITSGKLELNGFEFVTTAEKVLDIVGETELVVSGNNSIRTVYNKTQATNYGICSDSKLTMSGTGRLDVYNANEDWHIIDKIYYSIYSLSDIKVTSGNYYFRNTREATNYAVYGKTLDISNANFQFIMEAAEGAAIYSTEGNVNIDNSDMFIQMHKHNNCEGNIADKHLCGIYTPNKVIISNIENPKYVEIRVADNVSGDEKFGYGISATGGIDISNSYMFIRSATSIFKGAMSGDIINIDGGITVSKDFHMTDTIPNQVNLTTSDLITEFKNNNSDYKYMKIEPKVISVDITWGDLDYTYTQGSWNPSTLSYNDGIWAPNDKTSGDKITVNNSGSNVPIKAGFEYSKEDAYNNITGTFKVLTTDKKLSTDKTITTDEEVAAGGTLNSYLTLNDRLSASTPAQTKVGKVVITLTE